MRTHPTILQELLPSSPDSTDDQSEEIEVQDDSDQDKADDFNLLADELKLHIFDFLSGPDLVICNLVCKDWHRLADEDKLWNKFLSEDELQQHPWKTSKMKCKFFNVQKNTVSIDILKNRVDYISPLLLEVEMLSLDLPKTSSAKNLAQQASNIGLNHDLNNKDYCLPLENGFSIL